jgi:hemin uptake protein HemP
MPGQDRRTDDARASSAEDDAAPSAKSLSSDDGADDGSIDFLQLAQGRREILVRLAGQTYRLRWTRNDKLILTK